MISAQYYDSPVGMLLLAGQEEALVGVWIAGQKYFPDSLAADALNRGPLPVLRQAAAWLDRYFAGERPAIGQLPLAPAGSGFQQEVWRLLRDIPYGETVTYGELARTLAARRGVQRMSPRAVGGAVGRNPISIIIPCHRVVGANGNLTGYAGGLPAKIKLLAHERATAQSTAP